MTKLLMSVEELAVVQPIVPFAIAVFRGPAFNCAEVRRDESPKTRDGAVPVSVQLELEEVFELNEIVSANAAIGLISNTKKPIRITLRMRVFPPWLSIVYLVQFIFQMDSKPISSVFIRLEIAEESNRLSKDKKLHDLALRFPDP